MTTTTDNMLNIGASQIGRCMNKLFYKYTGKEARSVQSPEDAWKSSKRMELGSYGEDVTEEFLTSFYDFKVSHRGENLSLTVVPFEVVFDIYIDGILEDEDGNKYIWENKFVSEYSNFEKQLDTYADQIQLTAKLGKVHFGIDKVFFTVMTRGFNMEHSIIELDELHYQRLEDKAKQLHHYISTGEFPACNADPDVCKWCDYNNVCETFNRLMEDVDFKGIKNDFVEMQKELKSISKEIARMHKRLLKLKKKGMQKHLTADELNAMFGMPDMLDASSTSFVEALAGIKEDKVEEAKTIMLALRDKHKKQNELSVTLKTNTIERDSTPEEEAMLSEYAVNKAQIEALEAKQKAIKAYFEAKMLDNKGENDGKYLLKVKGLSASVSLQGRQFGGFNMDLLPPERLKEIRVKKIVYDYNHDLLTPQEKQLIAHNGVKKFVVVRTK